MVGPSLSYKIKDNLSIGASLYYLRHFTKNAVTDTYNFTDKTWEEYIINEQKKVSGYNPVVGLMYMPTEKLSLGVSIQKKYVVGGTRNNNLLDLTSSTLSSDDAYYVYGSPHSLNGVYQNKLSYLTPLTATIPQTSELRMGIAYFLSHKVLFSFDYIKISGYSKKKNQYEFITYEDIPQFIYYGNKEYETYRKPTENFAVGTELDILPFLTLRMGFFTNFSSNQKRGWIESMVETVVRQEIIPLGIAEDKNLSVLYFPTKLIRPYYADYSSPKGYTLGISFTGTAAVFTFTHIREIGNDMTFYYPTNPPVNLYYKNQVYNISITTRN